MTNGTVIGSIVFPRGLEPGKKEEKEGEKNILSAITCTSLRLRSRGLLNYGQTAVGAGIGEGEGGWGGWGEGGEGEGRGRRGEGKEKIGNEREGEGEGRGRKR